MGNLKLYIDVVKEVRKERGEFCECCGVSAKHTHHIIRVSESSIHSPLVYEKGNLIILCDDCHALMHPLLRNVSQWKIASKDRGQALNRQL